MPQLLQVRPRADEQVADANLVTYSRDMKNALAQADPGALLMMGFSPTRPSARLDSTGSPPMLDELQPGVDYRVPGRAAQVSIFGAVDILDIHVYPNGSSYSLTTDLNSIEYSRFAKPHIIGEFGAIKSVYASNITTAACAMKNLQIASCKLGAKGWLWGTWDTDTTTSLASQSLFYSLADSRGAINGQLASSPGRTSAPDRRLTTSHCERGTRQGGHPANRVSRMAAEPAIRLWLA